MRHLGFIVDFVLVVFSIGALAQDSARTVQYHSQDIVPIRAKVKYTTLIELPTTEKIMEAATGDKEFWIVDVVGNFCFVHPAKQGISSNLNLITDKGNIYSCRQTQPSRLCRLLRRLCTLLFPWIIWACTKKSCSCKISQETSGFFA